MEEALDTKRHPTFGGLLTGILRLRDLTPAWLAQISGLGDTIIQSILSDKADLSQDIVDRLGKAMARPMDSDIGVQPEDIQRSQDFYSKFAAEAKTNPQRRLKTAAQRQAERAAKL